MRWSKLKQLIEAGMADSLAGRVSVYATRYPKADDGDVMGRGWITIDGVEVANFCDYKYLNRRYALERELANVNPADSSSTRQGEAASILDAQGELSHWEFARLLYGYLSLSIDDALGSEQPLVRALAMTDRRLGKRRLRAIDPRDLAYPLARRLYDLRCEAEGVRSALN